MAGFESSDNQSRFLEALDSVQSELAASSVDFRIIGGVSTVAMLERANPGSTTVNFNRASACTPDQRVPDIDLVVPRSDVPVVRALRAKYLSGDFPVKLGAAAAVNHFDFLPNSDISYLTHGKSLRRSIPTELLEPDTVSFLGVPIKTVLPATLFHTYQTCGGMIRQKDLPKLRALRSAYPVAEGKYTEEDYRPFHDFIKERAATYPHFVTLARAKDLAERKLPGKGYNRLLQIGLATIDTLHIPIR